MTTYRIAYNHTSSRTAASLTAAQEQVADEAMRTQGGASAREDVVYVRCEDGTYAYLSQEDADADETGAAAFAAISRVDEDDDA